MSVAEPPLHPRNRLYQLFDKISSNAIPRIEIRYEGLEDDEAFELAKALSENFSLEEIDLTSSSVSSSGILQICNRGLSHQLCRVKKLSVASNKVTKEGAVGIAKFLCFNSTIVQLNLHDARLQSEGILALAKGLQNQQSLKKLTLSKNVIGESVLSCRVLGDALQTTSIHELDLSANKIGSRALEALGLHRVASIQILKLFENSIEQDGGIFFADLLLNRNSQLSELNIRNNDLGDVGVQTLAIGLARNRALRKLYLSSNRISNNGCVALANAMVTTNLAHLYLSCNAIGSEGAVALAHLLKSNTALSTLDLYQNHIGNRGGRALAQVLEDYNITITDLHLSRNRIVGDSVRVLRQLRFFTKTNQGGRYVLRDETMPSALWAHILHKLNYRLDVRYFFLRQKPELFQR